MKKIIFLTSFLALATSVVFGQTIPNPSFEDWSTATTPEPVGWASSNAYATALSAGVTVTKVTPGQAGTSAADLVSKSGATVVPGLITTGTISGTTVIGGLAYTTRSTNLTGYYQYTPSGADVALVSVFLSKRNLTTNKRDTIAYGTFTPNSTVTTYTAFDVVLNYTKYNNAAAPDSELIIMSSSKNFTAAIAGSVLLVDNLSFSGVFTGINESNITANSSAYPNPAVNELTITTDEQANGISLYDIAGRKMDEVTVENKMALINTAIYAKGIYYYTVTGRNNAVMSKGKFAVVK